MTHPTMPRTKNMMKFTLYMCLLFTKCLLALPAFGEANQADSLQRLLKSRRSNNSPFPQSWPELHSKTEFSIIHIEPQHGLMQADKIDALPGQPDGVDFDQYSGYVTVDPKAGRALFYYFVESPQNFSTKPLVLWLNGGPGCSSLGYGAMEELGPFRVNSDGRTLFRNIYAWNNVANVIFLESPAGVGFSYSNSSPGLRVAGDKSTADDTYTFLVNWLERFPHYKTRDFFIAGESYAGHYVPQLAYTVLQNNKKLNQTIINLKGIAIGNAWVDDLTDSMGVYDYLWSHALISDETKEAIHLYCYSGGNYSDECYNSKLKALSEMGRIDFYDIYAPLCHDTSLYRSTGSVFYFNPCSYWYVESYLNTAEVQIAFHANPTTWSHCSGFNWTDSPVTVLPIIKNLITSGIRIWMYSGDTDENVPVTSSSYSINNLKLPINTPWRPWYTSNEVGGYVVEYEGLTFVTVRGAGHLVPSYKPERAITMISSFLQGSLLPFSP